MKQYIITYQKSGDAVGNYKTVPIEVDWGTGYSTAADKMRKLLSAIGRQVHADWDSIVIINSMEL